MYFVRTHHRRRGNALLVILALIIIVGISLASLATYSRHQRTEANKQARQQSATASVENRFGGIIGAGRQMLETKGLLSLSDWAASSQESSAEVTGGYQATNAVAATDGSAVLRPPATAANSRLSTDSDSVLGNKDDPFKGARAYTLPATLTVEAARADGVMQLADEGASQVAGKVSWKVTAGLRVIPMSQFSLFTGSSCAVDASKFPAGVGRAYVGGDATISGDLSSDYRTVVAGNISMGAGGTLRSKASPGDKAPSVLTTASTDPQWRNVVRPTDAVGGIVTGAEMPTKIAIPATVAQMVGSPRRIESDRNPYRLSGQASRVVRLVEFDPLTGGKFVVTDASGQVVANPGPWRASLDARNRDGGPTITFAYAEQYGANALAPSYYVMSEVPGALLILRQTRILTAPLSVATPLPTAVINGLDDLAPGNNPNDPALHTALPRYANSIISGAGEIAIWKE